MTYYYYPKYQRQIAFNILTIICILFSIFYSYFYSPVIYLLKTSAIICFILILFPYFFFIIVLISEYTIDQNTLTIKNFIIRKKINKHDLKIKKFKNGCLYRKTDNSIRFFISNSQGDKNEINKNETIFTLYDYFHIISYAFIFTGVLGLISIIL